LYTVRVIRVVTPHPLLYDKIAEVNKINFTIQIKIGASVVVRIVIRRVRNNCQLLMLP
jgi:hypothetical protein